MFYAVTSNFVLKYKQVGQKSGKSKVSYM